MKTLLLASAALFALVLAPSSVFAGGGNNTGGGTKQNGTVSVHNDTNFGAGGAGTEVIAVLAGNNNPLTNLQAQLTNPSATRASIRTAAAQDGAQVRFIAAGNSATFTNVKAGNQTLTFVDSSGNLSGGQGGVTINKGKTTTVSVSSNGTTFSSAVQ